jgi:hypothetical protein
MKDCQATTEACNPSGEYPALQNIKDLRFFNCCGSEFMNPDPAFQVNPDSDPVLDLIQ